MASEDWFHFQPQCCFGTHSGAYAGQLNDQQDPHC